MGVLTDLILATDAEINAYWRTPYRHLPNTAITDIKGIGTIEFTALHGIALNLTNKGGHESVQSLYETPIAADLEDGPWVFRVPMELVTRLAQLTSDERAAIELQWARTDEFVLRKATDASVRYYLDAICDLAAKAVLRNEYSLYLWISL